jgi:hypothetical protein
MINGVESALVISHPTHNKFILDAINVIDGIILSVRRLARMLKISSAVIAPEDYTRKI